MKGPEGLHGEKGNVGRLGDKGNHGEIGEKGEHGPIGNLLAGLITKIGAIAKINIYKQEAKVTKGPKV